MTKEAGGFKQVKCSVCGEMVNKAQTLHVGEGKRACRKHSTTATTSQAILSEEAKKKEAEVKELEEKRKSWRREETPAVMLPSCWICRKKGLRQDVWYSRLLIEHAKYELVEGHPPNPFNTAEAMVAAGPLVGVPCLMYVEWKGKNKRVQVPYQAYQSIMLQGDLMGEAAVPTLLVCTDCCREKGFQTKSEEHAEKLTAEQLKNWMVVAELARPDLQKMAMLELGKEALQDAYPSAL